MLWKYIRQLQCLLLRIMNKTLLFVRIKKKFSPPRRIKYCNFARFLFSFKLVFLFENAKRISVLGQRNEHHFHPSLFFSCHISVSYKKKLKNIIWFIYTNSSIIRSNLWNFNLFVSIRRKIARQIFVKSFICYPRLYSPHNLIITQSNITPL